MQQFLYIFIGIILGAGAVWVLTGKRVGELEVELKRTEKEKAEHMGIMDGIEEYNRLAQEAKEKRKQEILASLVKNGKIKTDGVADMLDISRATAFRYLEELEKEGKISQVGGYGRNVEYKRK